MARFVPRQAFQLPNAIPKTYFLGHHYAGLQEITKQINGVNLILECRDIRLPLTTHNPNFDAAFTGRERMVIYTKADLVEREELMRVHNALHRLHGDRYMIWSKTNTKATRKVLNMVKATERRLDLILPLRLLVVGMPNVGKSSLLNTLRHTGRDGKFKKAAKTADQPGVTRKLSNPVSILDAEDKGGQGSGAQIVDTPGVFLPYVDDGEAMIKVALISGIKKGLIDDTVLADYLLYRMNLVKPELYAQYCEPTNDINELLMAVAKREGKLKKEGVPNLAEAADRVLTLWRRGKLGKFMLDDFSDETMEKYRGYLENPPLSLNQAKKQNKQARAQEKAGA